MASSIIGLGDPKAVKKFSAFLAVDTAKKSYFNRKFMGIGPDSGMPIQMLPQLENDAGDLITFDLSIQFKQEPIEGDDTQEGTEEALKFYTDQVYIDQARGGTDIGGRMTRKRTIHNLRNVARKRQSEWWARMFDEQYFMYLSGSRGVGGGFIFPVGYTGRANNAFTAPDAQHILYGGAATSKATLAATDKASLSLIDKAVARAQMMGGGTEETPAIQPVMVDGEEHYVAVFNPWQEYDIRTNTSAGQWLDIQKAAAAAEGRASPIFKGPLGMHNNVVLHSHKNVIQFSDYGVGANVAAARGLFLGEQAAVCSFGSPGTGHRFSWYEEARDNGNKAIISTSSIFGIKKTTFNGKDFGVIALDTAAKDPTV